MTHKKHVLIVEHVWISVDEPSGGGDVTKDACKDCGQTRRTLHLSTDDSGDDQVDPEKVWQTWSTLLSKLQKEFTQLSGFKSPEKALNALRGRYRGQNTKWEDMPIRYLNLWESSPNGKQKNKALLAWAQGPVCNSCDTVARSLDELELEHVIPESKGGPSRLSNYQLMCRSCNQKKDNNMPAAMDQSAFAEGNPVPCVHKLPCTFFWEDRWAIAQCDSSEKATFIRQGRC